MKYALIQIDKGSAFADIFSAGKNQFQLIGLFPSIEDAENERNKQAEDPLITRIIIQVW